MEYDTSRQPPQTLSRWHQNEIGYGWRNALSTTLSAVTLPLSMSTD